MSFAIGCWVRDTALTANKRESEYREALFKSIISTNRKFDTTVPGMLGHNDFSKKQEEAVQQAKDFIWLMKG